MVRHDCHSDQRVAGSEQIKSVLPGPLVVDSKPRSINRFNYRHPASLSDHKTKLQSTRYLTVGSCQ